VTVGSVRTPSAVLLPPIGRQDAAKVKAPHDLVGVEIFGHGPDGTGGHDRPHQLAQKARITEDGQMYRGDRPPRPTVSTTVDARV
jgi:hypothetical protein